MTRKQKGEIAESEFQTLALRLGFIVSKPWGDSAPHDFLIQSPARHLYRIQVKSCWSKNVHAYVINAARLGNRLAYRAGDVDFIAAYIDLGPLTCPNCSKQITWFRPPSAGKVAHRAARPLHGRRPKTDDRRRCCIDRRLRRAHAWYLIPLRALRGKKNYRLVPALPQLPLPLRNIPRSLVAAGLEWVLSITK